MFRQIITSNAHSTELVILPILLQPYKRDVRICRPRHSAMASRRQRSTATDTAAAPAASGKRIEQLQHNNMCTYWPANSAFDLKRVLLRRLLFMNEDRSKYVSVGFYPARIYLPLVEFVVVRRDGGHKTIILSDEEVDAMDEVPPKLRDAICSGSLSVAASARAVPSD